AALLGDQYAQGRLTIAEFEARVDAAYRAASRDELCKLTRDLPVRLLFDPVTRCRVGSGPTGAEVRGRVGAAVKRVSWLLPVLVMAAVLAGCVVSLAWAGVVVGAVLPIAAVGLIFACPYSGHHSPR